MQKMYCDPKDEEIADLRASLAAAETRIAELGALAEKLEKEACVWKDTESCQTPQHIECLQDKLAAAEKERRESEAGADREEQMREEMQHERDNAITERDSLRTLLSTVRGALEHYRDKCKWCRGRGEYPIGPEMYAPCPKCKPARDALSKLNATDGEPGKNQEEADGHSKADQE
jgi:DNA repair exonuclease SbcCD ATPase subunit